MIKVPDECYHEYGADLDGCSTQEREGCGSCVLAKRITTHADRIRAMSDEELTRFIQSDLPIFRTFKQQLDWLRQPAEEGGNE